MKLPDISRFAGLEIIKGVRAEFNGAALRHERVQKRFLYAPVRHYQYNGLKYIAEAVQRGASGIVVEAGDLPFVDLNSIPVAVFSVPSTKSFLFWLAGEIRRKASYKVVALTGSIGKSSTLEYLNHMAGKEHLIFRNSGNFNNFYGVVETVFDCPAETEWLILELGAQHPNEIKMLAEMTAPDVAGVLNCEPVHLIGFGGSLKSVLNAKVEVFEAAAGKKWVFNADDKLLAEWVGTNRSEGQNVFEFKGTPENGSLGGVFSSATSAFLKAMGIDSICAGCPEVFSEKMHKGPNFDFILDLTCSSLPAMEALLTRISLYQIRNPNVPVTLITLGIPFDTITTPETLHYRERIENLSSLIRFEKVLKLSGLSEQNLATELQNANGLVVFQDARSRWTKIILEAVGRSEMLTQLFPPF